MASFQERASWPIPHQTARYQTLVQQVNFLLNFILFAHAKKVLLCHQD